MAGTITITESGSPPSSLVGVIVATCVADAADGSFPTTALPRFEGRILDIITDPGTPAPQALYDVTLPDADGFDRLGGAGANRSATVTERAAVTDGYVSRHEQVSIAVAGNNVNSAATKVTIHYTGRV